MKFFVTGVNGQLGHDVMNELHKRGHEGVGSDIQSEYRGVADGSVVAAINQTGCCDSLCCMDSGGYGRRR